MNKLKQPKIDLSMFVYATITKLSDDKFNGKHPNFIDKGYTSNGVVMMKPMVGYPCIVGSLRTSTVTEIVSETKKKIVFKTLNSTYKLEYDGKHYG